LKRTIIAALAIMPFYAQAAQDCHAWPMNMAQAWLKNAHVVDITQLDHKKTEIKLLAEEKKSKTLVTQVYHFIFYGRAGGRYEVITQNDASDIECSISGVNTWLIAQRDITH
jgi:aconitase B